MDPQPPAWRVFETPASSQGDGLPATTGDVHPKAGLSALGAGAPMWLGLAAALVIGVAAIAVAVGGLGGGTVEGLGPIGSSLASDASQLGELIVDVAGAVARPGLYHLASGARVGDAIAAAGGFGPRVDSARAATDLNLAALVHDGDRIFVPSRDQVSGPSGRPIGAPRPSPSLVDLNHATAAELDALPGIGPVTADKIVASRADTPFKSVDELRSRGLVGQKTFDKLRSLVTVG